MRITSWTSTTETERWHDLGAVEPGTVDRIPDVFVQLDDERQEIEGFGATFNELGWTSLAHLTDEQRAEIFREMYAPGVGGNFTVGRMPIAANDFARDYYSYADVPGDFDLEHFSIANDHETLVPYIRSAMEHQGSLKLWASPWVPPQWMKTNGHYASVQPWINGVENGLQPDQVQAEGTDSFIQDERHLATYAEYFGKFVDAYRELGIEIGMVMPQNEFNSAQPYPSCTWTPAGLAAFLRHLGPAMQERGVEVFLGTVERPNEALVDEVLADPAAASVVAGIGVQWHGKSIVPFLKKDHPELRLYQTEQECGDGKNDWRYARYSWRLMRDFLNNGANAYQYWNLSLERGGVSRWGWSQNSLVVVDPEAGSFEYTHEYYVLKHVSHFVQPGARLVPTLSYAGYENQVAFRNPDGSLVVVMQNDTSEKMPVSILVGDQVVSPVLPADSLSTFVVEV
jgi:glucosylceramidase